MKTEPNGWGNVGERGEGGKKQSLTLLTCIACLLAQAGLKAL